MFDFIIKKKIKKLCGNDSRQKTFRNLSEMQKVLVLFETDDYDAIDAFIEYLEKLGKQVKACALKSKNDNYDYSETPYRIIVPGTDTCRLGLPSDSLMSALKKESFDALLDMSIKENYTLEYIVAQSNIPFKVGYKKNDFPLYDLSITRLAELKEEANAAPKELCRQILHYLNIIHAKNV